MKFTFINFRNDRFLKNLPAALFEVEGEGGKTFEMWLDADEIQRNIDTGNETSPELKAGLKEYDLGGVEA